MYRHRYVHMSTGTHTSQVCGVPVSRVTGDHEPHNVVLATELKSCGRAVCALNC